MDVREKLFTLFQDCNNPSWKWFPNNAEMLKLIDYLIANDVTVQECGHWEDDHGDYVCSCCHTVFTDDLVWLVRGESNEPNHCPNCGAKMMPQPPKGDRQ